MKLDFKKSKRSLRKVGVYPCLTNFIANAATIDRLPITLRIKPF